MSRDTFHPSDPQDSSDFDIKERAASVASTLKGKANEVANTVTETLSRQRENAASGLDRVASTIHENAGSLPGGQKAADVANSIADGMQSSASYLREHDFKDLGDSLAGVCRKYPAQSFLSALAIGFLVGRAVRR